MTETDHDSSGKAPDAPAKPAAAPEVDAGQVEEDALQSSSTKATPAAESEEVEAAAEPADTEPVATEPAAAPKKGKKGRRKSKSAAADSGSAPRSELNDEGRERPAFLLKFPHDPELEPLIAAFEAGNYAHVREFAPRLAEHSEQPEVKAAAQELLERIEPDPLVKFLLAVAIALFVVVVAFVYHSHG